MSELPKTKHVISGREVELVRGKAYTAKWPIKIGDNEYMVLIVNDPRGCYRPLLEAIPVQGLTYSEASDFMAEFNSQTFTFVGRYWE